MPSPLLLPKVHRGVDDLVRRTLDVGTTRISTPTPIDLHGRDLDILQVLAELRYLTGQMLGVLAWGNCHGRFRSRLSALFSAGLLRRFRPPGRPGSNHWVYELAPAGYRALRDRRPERAPRWRPTELHSFAYAEHDLELNALLCELAARAAAHLRRDGPLMHAAPFTIIGPRAGRIDTEREHRPLEASPRNDFPSGHIVRPGRSQTGVLEPDATLIGIEATSGEPLAILIEYDRTRRASKLIAKLPRYDRFLADGWRRTRYATLPGEPAVLFVVRDDEDLGHVIRQAHRELTAWVGPSGADDLQGHFPGREELAFTTRSRLLAGADTVLQVNPQPEQTPGGKTQPTTIETFLPLTRLFQSQPTDNSWIRTPPTKPPTRPSPVRATQRAHE